MACSTPKCTCKIFKPQRLAPNKCHTCFHWADAHRHASSSSSTNTLSSIVTSHLSRSHSPSPSVSRASTSATSPPTSLPSRSSLVSSSSSASSFRPPAPSTATTTISTSVLTNFLRSATSSASQSASSSSSSSSSCTASPGSRTASGSNAPPPPPAIRTLRASSSCSCSPSSHSSPNASQKKEIGIDWMIIDRLVQGKMDSLRSVLSLELEKIHKRRDDEIRLMRLQLQEAKAVFNEDYDNAKNCVQQRKALQEAEMASGGLQSVLATVIALVGATPFWLSAQARIVVDALDTIAEACADTRQQIEFLRHSHFVPPLFDCIARLTPDRSKILSSLSVICTTLTSCDVVDLPQGCQFRHPFLNNFKCKQIKVLKIFESNAHPVLVDFLSEDRGETVMSGCPAIIKGGDDLRRDLGCLQVFRLFKYIWGTEGHQYFGVPIQARTYNVTPFGPNLGFVQFVEGCESLGEMGEIAKDFSSFQLANLVASSVGAFVGSYVLGVKDRHSDNIMVHALEGHLLHIDFGHILGDAVTLDTADFAITPQLKTAMKPQGWKDFIHLCSTAFQALRKAAPLIFQFAEALLAPVSTPGQVRSYLHRALLISETEAGAKKKIEDLLEDAPGHYQTRLKNMLHRAAVGRSRSPSSRK